MSQYSWNFFEASIATCFCGVRHSDGGSPERRLQVVRTSLILVTTFCLVQWLIGRWSGSLALQADAGHLLSDVFALAVTLTAIWLARRPANERATFGYQRVEILAALLNGLSLLGVSGWIIYESWSRWQMPENILSTPMILGSLIGLLINLVNLLALYQESKQNLNLKAVFLHTVSDFVGSIGAMIAAITIHFWHCLWIDTFIGFMVAGLTIATALPLLKESLEVFLEYAPATIDVKAIRHVVLGYPGVKQIDALKLWSLTQETVALCLKIQVSMELSLRDRDQLLKQLEIELKQNFQIYEITIQISSLSVHQGLGVHPLFQQSLVDQVLVH